MPAAAGKGCGGKRPGAGRKKGSPNKRSVEIAAGAVAAGITPLEYMLAVMRDKGADLSRRDEMAKAAAPFIHPRLSAIQGVVDGPPVKLDVDRDPLDIARRVAFLLAQGAAAA